MDTILLPDLPRAGAARGERDGLGLGEQGGGRGGGGDQVQRRGLGHHLLHPFADPQPPQQRSVPVVSMMRELAILYPFTPFSAFKRGRKTDLFSRRFSQLCCLNSLSRLSLFVFVFFSSSPLPCNHDLLFFSSYSPPSLSLSLPPSPSPPLSPTLCICVCMCVCVRPCVS